jgi:hypothetical protein
LPFTLKKKKKYYLKAKKKKNYGNSNISPCKSIYSLQKNPV